MKQVARKFLAMVLAVVFAVSTGMLSVQWYDGRRSEAALRDAQTLAEQALPDPPVPQASTPQTGWIPAAVTDADPYLEVLASMDLAALRRTGEAVVGWILIPGTRIDYPLVQGADNQFYLEHSWDGAPNRYGAIFLETVNSPDFSDFNTIVYGHNMRDGSMFAALHDFADAEFWAEHPYIYLLTDAGVFRYRVFSTYEAAVESRTYGLSFRQQQTRVDFIQHALDSSEQPAGDTPAVTDRILTLSTCTGWGYEYRRVVHGYLEMVEVTLN